MQNPMSFLPPELQPYSSLITIALLFFDGLLFGVAAKKAVVAVVLIVVGIILAGFIGLSLPFLSVDQIWTHVINIMWTQAKYIGPIFFGFPIFWVIGLAIGIWKG